MYNPSTDFYSHKIQTSLRFNDDNSAFLSRTPSSAGNRRTFTLSFWIKRANIVSGEAYIFSAGHTNFNTFGGIEFINGEIVVQNYNGGTQVIARTGTSLFRDNSSWYNIVWQFDSTQSTAANRTRLYVNGTQVTNFDGSDSDLTQNYEGQFNDARQHTFGCRQASSQDAFLDAYLAEVNFIDGAALTPSSFGETKEGIWIAKDTSGLTFGTNGFRLQFKNSSVGSASSSTIGADTSGNNNHFASSGIVASDCALPDCPENNFATLNSLVNTPQVTFKEGNLFSDNGATHKTTTGTLPVTSGKWYFEGRASNSSNKWTIGITNSRNVFSQQVSGTNHIIGYQSPTYAYGDAAGLYYETIRKNGSVVTSNVFGDSSYIDDDDIMGCAFDADSGKIWFSKNGTWLNGSATNSTTLNTGSHDTTVTAGEQYVSAWSGENSDWAVNYGQDSSFGGRVTAQNNTDSNGIGNFYYAPPTDFLALCSANLPDVTIGPEQDTLADDHFNTVLWTGDNSVPRNITGVGFSPDWIWVKDRIAANNNVLVDTVRGISELLYSNSTVAGVTSATQISAVGTDGFTIGSNTYMNENGSSNKYVAWNWLAGTAFSNDASATGVGTIDSTGQVNTTAGFSIISYTGNGSSSQTVAHGLSSTPEIIFHKDRDTNSNNNQWNAWHEFAGDGDDYGYLSVTNAFTGSAQIIPSGTTTIELKANLATTNENGDDFIMYAFHSVEGYSKVGSYIGNGSTNGPYVHTGFRPVWILLRESGNARNWVISYDDSTYHNGLTHSLFPNISQAEDSYSGSESGGGGRLDFLSNGFKLRTTSTSWNNNNGNFIYMAFADQPFKFSNAR